MTHIAEGFRWALDLSLWCLGALTAVALLILLGAFLAWALGLRGDSKDLNARAGRGGEDPRP